MTHVIYEQAPACQWAGDVVLVINVQHPALPYSALYQWYHHHGRGDLPWRQTSDPYAIYVSEVMLQQTQVATVQARYYHPFLQRFPDLETLAAAPQADILKAWEGLGYYSRARHLHQAAQRTAPALPDDIAGLMALPGIGRNTAHAIAAFAFHQPVPVMEANVKRVLHRLYGFEAMSDKGLWEAAQALVDTNDPFTYNQAMMDIGALICTPTAPQCLICPLADACAGKTHPESYPAPKAKKAPPVRKRRIVVFLHEECAYMTPRQSRFLGGLYGFPEYLPADAVTLGSYQTPETHLISLGAVSQTYSHFRLDADTYLCRLANRPADTHTDHWHRLDRLTDLPSSRADQKVMTRLFATI